MPKGVTIGAVIAIAAFASAARGQMAPAAPDTLAVGDWKLAPVVEARAHGEYRYDLDGESRGMVEERARLGVDASNGAIEARVVLQDARVLDLSPAGFLEGPPPAAVTGAYEGWVEAHTDAARPSFVRVGRQPITWGEGRLLGASDWSPTGRALDAVRARWARGDGAVELLAALLEDEGQGTGFDGPVYGELFGARGEMAFDPLFALEAYALARVAQSDPALESNVRGQTYTGDLRLHGDRQDWVWSAEGALQLGHVGEGFVGARLAWASAAHVSYTFADAVLRPTIGVGGAYATGDDGGTTYHGFDPLLPDVHEWHGAMDVFSWSNEAEANARVAIAPWSEGVASVEYRYARLAQPGGAWQSAYLMTLGQAIGNTRADLGHEIDASVGWSPWAPVRLQAGYSILILGAGAKAALTAIPVSSGAAFGTPAAAVSHYAFLDARLAF